MNRGQALELLPSQTNMHPSKVRAKLRTARMPKSHHQDIGESHLVIVSTDGR